ncbi:Sucrose-phosphate synthase [Acorus calamus]|uniref:sucrose-phosphate synthase n=1 Tax=Acorus calamus TaxID=4465 RepID=A0AAV9C0L7_ACOCL|nr:Sucrose-phosphate synthase [Acorus calamus]
MAGNEWINGYLEAILDVGATVPEEQRSSHPSPRERGGGGGGGGGLPTHFNPTRYFVEEVVTGVDETDLHRTWIKIELEEFQNMAKRRLEREQGRRDATEDMAEDLSEGERGDILGELTQTETPKKKFQRNFSDLQVWSDDNKGKKLYIVLISLHGLVRGDNMELGRDSDTGGQVKYVVELARALAMMPGVYRVDLFTRQVSAPDVDWSYGEPTEMLTSGSYDLEGHDGGESCGAYIIRIPFGPRDKYLRKELLWPYIQEFVDGALAHILNMSRVLGEQKGGGQPVWPYVIHGHYADAGDSAALLSGALNVPMVLTGHSLGRNKLEQLLKQGRQSKEDINATYKIMRRIEAEELSLDAAELVVTSTRQEIDEQWGLYDGFDVKLEKVLRARLRRGVSCHGRYMPRMAVIPPGMDFSSVIVQEDTPETESELAAIISADGASPRAVPPIWTEVMRFFTNPHKPMILALSRPDPKKNITTLLKAFGECRPLRELANLTLIMGNRDDIEEMSGGNANVLTTVLKLIDKYDLYGQVAYPKHHKQSDVPEIYRLAGKQRESLLIQRWSSHLVSHLLRQLRMGFQWWLPRMEGLLTFVGVAACRMRHPQWQTDTPLDDANADESLGDSLKDVQDISLRLSVDGDKSVEPDMGDVDLDIQDQVKRVLNKIRKSGSEASPEAAETKKQSESGGGNALTRYPLLRRRRRLFVIALDCYDEKGGPEKKMLHVIQDIFRAIRSDSQMSRISGFALSTAMPLSETLDVLKMGRIPPTDFDALICGSGSEVYYPGTTQCTDSEGKLCPDPDYSSHIDYRWSSDGVKRTILKLMSVGDSNESGGPIGVIEEDLKSSNVHCARKVNELRQKLRMRGIRCHLMYSRNSTRLQVIPLLASRCQALRYLFVRWGLNVANMYVILGETGDTDHEELISGSHKTVIMKGIIEKGSEALLRTAGSYPKDDIIPSESPLIVHVNCGQKSEDILSALKGVSRYSSGLEVTCIN